MPVTIDAYIESLGGEVPFATIYHRKDGRGHCLKLAQGIDFEPAMRAFCKDGVRRWYVDGEPCNFEVFYPMVLDGLRAVLKHGEEISDDYSID